jgi:hypothetical protein
MVAFRLGQQRDPHDEFERSAEVVERELAGQVAGGIALPARNLGIEPGDLRLWERWRPRRVLLAVLVDKLGDGRTVLVKRRGVGGRILRINGLAVRRASDLLDCRERERPGS